MDFKHLAGSGTCTANAKKKDLNWFITWAVEEMKTTADNTFSTLNSDPIYVETISKTKDEAVEEIGVWQCGTACEYYIACANDDN